jgi:hypothetical protein
MCVYKSFEPCWLRNVQLDRTLLLVIKVWLLLSCFSALRYCVLGFTKPRSRWSVIVCALCMAVYADQKFLVRELWHYTI